MALEQIIDILVNTPWSVVIFKLIAVLFSIGYLAYVVIFYQQQQKIIENTLIYYNKLISPQANTIPKNATLSALAILQTVFGLLLVIFSLLFL